MTSREDRQPQAQTQTQAQPDGLSQEEVSQQAAEEMPDREAMTVLSGSLLEPLVQPIAGVLSGSIIDQVTTQLPDEVAGIDIPGVATGTLGEDSGPLDALPPELVPDTQQVTEDTTISGTAPLP